VLGSTTGSSVPRVHWRLEHPDLVLGLCRVDGLSARPADGELAAYIEAELARIPDPPEATQKAIRQLLKRGGFKATGRNKPASEYLVEARRRGEWPKILDCVDVMNLVSLESGFPISILDLGRLDALHPGRELCVRFGQEGERYVFNQAGHIIDLNGLLGLAIDGGEMPIAGSASTPGEMLANPVKDSVPTKVQAGASSVLIAIYASRLVADEAMVRDVAARFAKPFGGGAITVLTGPAASVQG